MRAIPHVTYTDPELAQVGLTEAEARAADPRAHAVRAEFAENDRALTARQGRGFAKLVLDRRGRLVGATIVGPHAGELIGLVALAIGQKAKLSALAAMTLALSHPGRGRETGGRRLLHRRPCSAGARGLWCGFCPGSGEARGVSASFSLPLRALWHSCRDGCARAWEMPGGLSRTASRGGCCC